MPLPSFKEVEASRPDFNKSARVTHTKTPNPDWQLGQGASDGGASLEKKHIEIDPFASDREPRQNYTLMISGIVPRPIGFISTISADGKSTNVAPYSFTQMVNFDPPILVVGMNGIWAQKDSLYNLIETGECVVNTVSEHFVEAANEASINTPYGESEFEHCGLHPAPSAVVEAPRVQESIFSIECRLVEVKKWTSKRDPTLLTGATVFLEAVRYWAREDAINENHTALDISVLKPVSRLGGISYSRTTEVFELPRPSIPPT